MKLLKIKHLGARAIMIWLVAVLYFKFLYFDLVWAFGTTFRGFQFPVGYTNKLLLCCLLALPMLAIRRKWYACIISLLVDAWLVCNLMYFRTYYTIIPSTSYLLAGNLADFQASVWESLRWSDIFFPLSTAVMMWAWRHTRVAGALRGHIRRLALWLGAGIAGPALILAGYLAYYGGFKTAYEDLLYDGPTCGAAVYTIPGALLYERYSGTAEYTPEVEDTVQAWLDDKPSGDTIPYSITPPESCIIILCESLESWVIGAEVEGQVITPNLNRLAAEDSVLYAPNMQSQVKGARSIDAQLLIHTGLTPVNYGSFSHRFPHHTYCTLDKAFKENRGNDAVTGSFTVDKRTVWNAGIVAQDFGYDVLLDKPSWVNDVKTGPRHRLGDDSFLRQSYAKIKGEEIWKTGHPALIQLVTYSGHTPFIIPDNLKKLTFSDRIPERLRNYMQVANYTDRAIGAFVDSIRSNPKFDGTMIVITGDHEGIGADRASFVKDKEVARWLSPNQFTPFLVLNSPVTMRYDGVLGQVDMYPTLLDLLGLRSYHWHGMGRSILDRGKLPYAISPTMDIVGTDSIPEAELRHAREIYSISDLIICSDYFRHSTKYGNTDK